MSLKKKIDQLRDQDAKESVEAMQKVHENRQLAEAMFLLGRITQNDVISRSITANLSAQSIRAMERFQQEKRYEALGFTNFVDFLESEYSPISKRQYYDRLNLLDKNGDEIYDLLTSVGISVRAQKLLGNGDLAIKGDRLVIGDKEVEAANAGLVKDILNELFDERRSLIAEKTKAESNLEKEKQKNRVGEKENEKLRRRLDELDESPRFTRSFMTLISAFINHTEAAGESFVDAQTAGKTGQDNLKLIAGLYFRLEEIYGVKVPLAPVKDSPNFIEKALSEMDMEDLD